MPTAQTVESEVLEYALRYAQAGYKVLPLHSVRGNRCSCGKPDCESKGKHPRLPNGAHGASSDEQTIRSWFQKWPDANLGMTLSGLVVVDVDPRHNGHLTIEALEARNGKLPETPI